MPPLPFNPFAAMNLNVYALGANSFAVDDTSLGSASRALSAGRMSTMDSSSDFTFVAPTYDSNVVWLDITKVSADLSMSCLVLHPPWDAASPVYDLFSTTNLGPDGAGLNVTNWVWVLRTGSGQTNLTVTNLPAAAQFFMLATTNDTDGDGLSDAFEKLVSHSNPANASTIGGGIPDLWVWNNFGAAGFNLTPDWDYDGDGSSISDEYAAGIDPNKIAFTVAVTNQFVNTSLPPVQLNVSGGVPSSMAVLVDSTNFSGATWTPYSSSNITVNLGTTQGWHDVWIGLRGRMTTSQQTWQWLRFKLDTTPPQLVITNPASTNISQPMIQLAGLCPESLDGISYDITNATGQLTNQQVLVLKQDYSTNTFEFTTNYFQAFDIELTNGLNTITLRATDLAGNVTVTNFSLTLDYSNACPPAIKLYWPLDGRQISGSTFIWRGWVDDFTAQLTVQTVDTNGVTNSVDAIVERNGNFWAENLPLDDGTNTLILTATDAAGQSSSTNISVVKATVNLTIGNVDPVQSTVSGTIGTSGYTVWINGVQATPDGNNWFATNVPMFSIGNTMVYQARAIPNTDTNGCVSSEGSPDNPTSPIAIDVETDPDRPEGVYISSYSLTEHMEYTSADMHSTWDHTLNWRDGKGGTDTQHALYHDPDYDQDYGYIESWPATSWPQPPSGHMTEVAYNNNEGIRETNVCDNYWPLLDSEHCDVNFQTNIGWAVDTNGLSIYTGDTHVTWRRQAQVVYALNTGGKAIPGVKNLWVISASATNRAVYYWPGYTPWGVDVDAVPYEQIQIGTLWHLGNDGNLNVLLPDGDPDVTSKVAGKIMDINKVTAANYGPLRHVCNALTPTNRYRLTLGVGEGVQMYWNPKTWWSHNGGGLVVNNPWFNALFIAPGTAGKVSVTGTIIFTNGNPPISDKVEFTVVEPSGVKATIRGNPDPYNSPFPKVGAGMHMNVVLQPTTVSFYQVEMEEPSATATTTEYFNLHPPHDHDYDRGADHWHRVDYNNLVDDGDFDHAWDAWGWPIGVAGTYTWPIHPVWRIVGGSKTNSLNGWTEQKFTLSSNGTMRIDKLDHHVIRSAYEPSGTAQ